MTPERPLYFRFISVWTYTNVMYKSIFSIHKGSDLNFRKTYVNSKLTHKCVILSDREKWVFDRFLVIMLLFGSLFKFNMWLCDTLHTVWRFLGLTSVPRQCRLILIIDHDKVSALSPSLFMGWKWGSTKNWPKTKTKNHFENVTQVKKGPLLVSGDREIGVTNFRDFQIHIGVYIGRP